MRWTEIQTRDMYIQINTSVHTNNYIVSEGQDVAESLQKCKETTEQAIFWFKKSGLCVNVQKTEVCMFNKNDVGRHRVELIGLSIEVNKQIKVLGLIFDTKLAWFAQARKQTRSSKEYGW